VGSLFGTIAPAASDWIAVFEVGIAILLLAGMFVVRRGHVRLHKYIQSSMVLVNIPVVLAWMVPQYLRYVLPGLPGEIAEPYYLLPTIALFAGALAEGLGIYILLAAGTGLIPERYRFRRYKLWMRTELSLWWLVVVLGLLIYYVWYPHAAPASSGYTYPPGY
jgi:uncharacterized membrane protein YozB (DUF420 family)